jgi:hypothetical protein
MPSDARRRHLRPTARKAVLSLHITASVALLGVVVTVLILGTRAVTTSDRDMSRLAYEFMDVVDHALLPPLAVVALGTGVLLSVATPWGLLRHWWILVKLALTLGLIATGIVLVDARVTDALEADDPDGAGLELIVISLGHALMLVAASVISVFKPWGRVDLARPWRAIAALARPGH